MGQGQFSAADVDQPTTPAAGQTGQYSAADVDPTPAQPRGFLSQLATQPSQFSHANPVRYLDELGQGMAQGAEALAHPIDTAKQVYKFATTPVGHDPSGDVPLSEGLGNVADTVAQSWGQTAAGAAAGKVASKVPISRVAGTGLKVAQGVAEDIPVVRQAGKIAKYWKETAPADTAAPAPAPEVISPSRTMPGQHPPEVIKPPAAQIKPPLRPDQRLLPEQTPGTIESAAASTSRTMPGQLAREFTKTQTPQVPTTPEVQPWPPRGLPASPRGAELSNLPVPKAEPTNPADALFGIGKKTVQTPAEAPPIKRGSLSQMLSAQLEKGLDAAPPLKSDVPLRGQISATMKEAAPQLPEGHTAVDSTALRSFKYDPQTQEFEAWPTSGDTAYRYGEVSPDVVKAFQDAPSKGKAFQQIKNSGTLVAKRVNGKWVSVKPARGSIAEGMPTK